MDNRIEKVKFPEKLIKVNFRLGFVYNYYNAYSYLQLS